jgi:hypothetical protein
MFYGTDILSAEVILSWYDGAVKVSTDSAFMAATLPKIEKFIATLRESSESSEESESKESSSEESGSDADD